MNDPMQFFYDPETYARMYHDRMMDTNNKLEFNLKAPEFIPSIKVEKKTLIKSSDAPAAVPFTSIESKSEETSLSKVDDESVSTKQSSITTINTDDLNSEDRQARNNRKNDITRRHISRYDSRYEEQKSTITQHKESTNDPEIPIKEQPVSINADDFTYRYSTTNCRISMDSSTLDANKNYDLASGSETPPYCWASIPTTTNNDPSSIKETNTFDHYPGQNTTTESPKKDSDLHSLGSQSFLNQLKDVQGDFSLHAHQIALLNNFDNESYVTITTVLENIRITDKSYLIEFISIIIDTAVDSHKMIHSASDGQLLMKNYARLCKRLTISLTNGQQDIKLLFGQILVSKFHDEILEILNDRCARTKKSNQNIQMMKELKLIKKYERMEKFILLTSYFFYQRLITDIQIHSILALAATEYYQPSCFLIYGLLRMTGSVLDQGLSKPIVQFYFNYINQWVNQLVDEKLQTHFLLLMDCWEGKWQRISELPSPSKHIQLHINSIKNLDFKKTIQIHERIHSDILRPKKASFNCYGETDYLNRNRTMERTSNGSSNPEKSNNSNRTLSRSRKSRKLETIDWNKKSFGDGVDFVYNDTQQSPKTVRFVPFDPTESSKKSRPELANVGKQTINHILSRQ
ncbi:hypothetical protein HDV02_006258 [Globomyces sp. JEL0801]|nr:hypothetical protein HDV02_006258 [Globomyces sp. JEL0801]